MAIKMRNNSDQESVCCNCGQTRAEVLDMFDLCIGTTIVTICDVCNGQLLAKVLKAETIKNGRIKSGHDMAIIRKRGQAAHAARRSERMERNAKQHDS